MAGRIHRNLTTPLLLNQFYKIFSIQTALLHNSQKRSLCKIGMKQHNGFIVFFLQSNMTSFAVNFLDMVYSLNPDFALGRGRQQKILGQFCPELLNRTATGTLSSLGTKLSQAFLSLGSRLMQNPG